MKKLVISLICLILLVGNRLTVAAQNCKAAGGYEVQLGDNLWVIAARQPPDGLGNGQYYDLIFDETNLAAVGNSTFTTLTSPSLIVPGYCLKIPPPPIGTPPSPIVSSGSIFSAGSSTVEPVTEAMALRFRSAGNNVGFSVEGEGTETGFTGLCNPNSSNLLNTTDIAGASRLILDDELRMCRSHTIVDKNGRPSPDPIEPVRFEIATDTIVIVVSTQNKFVQSLSLDDLAILFQDNTATGKTWDQLNQNSFPSNYIIRVVPEGGTLDVFVERVFQPAIEQVAAQFEADMRAMPNTQFLTDDNTIAQLVAGDQYAIGFMGRGAYLNHKNTLRAIPLYCVEEFLGPDYGCPPGNPPIMPDLLTALDRTYPLTRSLYIYTRAEYINSDPAVRAFINFYLDSRNNLQPVLGQVGYFPPSTDAYTQSTACFRAILANPQSPVSDLTDCPSNDT